MTVDRFPKLTIEDFSLVNSNQSSCASHLNFSFGLHGNSDLFLQVSRVIINFFDFSTKFYPDFMSSYQVDMLNIFRVHK